MTRENEKKKRTYNTSDELLGAVPVCLLRVSSDLVNDQKEAPQASPTNRLAAQADHQPEESVKCTESTILCTLYRVGNQ